MGVSLVGQGSKQEVQYPVVIRNVNVNSNPATAAASMYTTGVLVPKGTYSVTIQIPGVGNPGGTSVNSASYDFPSNDITATIVSIEADTGRPGPLFARSGPFKETFILNKDSYVYATLNSSQSSAGLANLRPDIVLTPKKPKYIALPTVTANRTQTAATSATAGSISDINVGFISSGWDYDNNYPFIAVGESQAAVSLSNVMSAAVTIFRFNPATGKWTNKRWTSHSLSSGSSWYTGFSGPAAWTATPTFTQFFIKGNFFHCLNMQGMLVNSSNRWGWIKADLSSAGSALVWEPGHTNTAFCELDANIDAGNNNRMIYYWDKVSHKVIYNGSRNITFNGTWSQYGWRHKWGQWDIATNTVDYQLSNGVIDPRTAGSSADSNAGWNSAVPSAADGNSYVIGINGTSEYLARFNRNGTYTGVGTITAHHPFNPTAATSLSNSSQFNTLDYLPGNYARWGSSSGNITKEYNAASGTTYYMPDGASDTGSRLYRNVVYGTYQIGAGPYINGFITNEWIVALVTGYSKYTGNTSRYTFPVTIYMTPATTENIAQALSIPGGVTSTADGNTGINNGTW